MAAPRNHTYLATALVSYVREDMTKQRHMNQVVAVAEHRVDLHTLETAKLGILQRLELEMGVKKEDLKDFVFLAFSYLGHMSEREFEGKVVKPTAPNAFQH